jgi:hypothetical protein
MAEYGSANSTHFPTATRSSFRPILFALFSSALALILVLGLANYTSSINHSEELVGASVWAHFQSLQWDRYKKSHESSSIIYSHFCCVLSWNAFVSRVLPKSILNSAEDEMGVPYNTTHEMSPELSANFCAWCLDFTSSVGVGGCRSEFYTDENLKKCGVDIGTGLSNSTASK